MKEYFWITYQLHTSATNRVFYNCHTFTAGYNPSKGIRICWGIWPQNQNHSRFVNRLIFLRSWYVWDLHLILHLRLKFSLNLLRLLRGEGEFGRLGLVSSRVDEEVCSPNLPMLTSSAPFHAELKSTTKLQLHAASLLPLCPARFGLFRSCANSSKTSHSDASTSH